MAEIVRVVVDAMGGDNAPAEPVKAAVEAVMCFYCQYVCRY